MAIYPTRASPYDTILNPLKILTPGVAPPERYQALEGTRGGGAIPPAYQGVLGGGVSIPGGETFEAQRGGGALPIPAAPAPYQFTPGSLYQWSGQPEVYRYGEGGLSWIPTPSTVEALGGYGVVKTVSPEVAKPGITGTFYAPESEGAMFRFADRPEVYMQKGGQFLHVASPEQLEALGGAGKVVILPAETRKYYQPYINLEQKAKTPTEEAYEKYRGEVGKNIPLIQQRYQSLLDQITKGGKEAGEQAGRAYESAKGGALTQMAQRGITGSSMELGAYGQLGEAYGRGLAAVETATGKMRTEATQEATEREQQIRDIMAKTSISEVEAVYAKQVADKEFGMKARMLTNEELNDIWKRSFAEVQLKMDNEYKQAVLRAQMGG